MTFDELVEEVYIITNRRDLEAETKSAVKSATLKAHKSDYYSKDIFETGIQWTTLSFRQSLDYISLFSNFRAFKYLRKAEDADDDTGMFFDIITADEILDSYGCNKNDIAYVAGRVIEIRSSTEFQFALLGCYVYPIVRETDYTSWVAEQFPFAIIHEASRRILYSIGKREEAKAQEGLTGEEYTEIKLSAITDVGS